MDYPEEEHTWLSRFTMMSIFGGFLFCIPGCLTLYRPLEGLLILALPVLLIIISVRTLHVTQNFRHWNNGISLFNKIISIIPIYFGLNLMIAFFFLAPFMGAIDGLANSITDSWF